MYFQCHIPDNSSLKKFVSRPPANDLRLHCTMIRHGDEMTGSNYTLYLEHLGGFLPMLKGKKTSKLRPEFVIFDPLKGKECVLLFIAFAITDSEWLGPAQIA